MTTLEKLESAEIRIAELENIVRIQAKQIERLIEARDIEAAKAINSKRWDDLFGIRPDRVGPFKK